MRINGVVAAFRRKTPSGVPAEVWDELLRSPETYGGVVHWLGLLERLLFLAACAIWLWPFVAVWLLFKPGYYWGIWQSIARVRGSAPEMNAMDFMVVQSRRANALTLTCLFSTLGNLLTAFLGIFPVIVSSGTLGFY